MSVRWDEEAPRLAALARLSLTPAEAEAIARACEAITREFSDLEAYAASLPEADAPSAGELREDVVAPAPAGEPDAILRAAPRVDARARTVLVPRGGA